ncbi:MAG: hypothetical protein ACYTF0_00470 [Planctomycetota bacterium]|jgi:ribosomal protein L34
MKVKIRTSATKHRKQVGFLARKKTRGGRATVRRQRNLAAGKPKHVKVQRMRHVKAKKVRQAK